MKKNRLLEIPVFMMGALMILIIATIANSLIGELKIETTFQINGQLFIFVLSCACCLAGVVVIFIFRLLTTSNEKQLTQVQHENAANLVAMSLILIKRTKNQAAVKSLGEVKLLLKEALDKLIKDDQARQALLYQAQETLEPKIETP